MQDGNGRVVFQDTVGGTTVPNEITFLMNRLVAAITKADDENFGFTAVLIHVLVDGMVPVVPEPESGKIEKHLIMPGLHVVAVLGAVQVDNTATCNFGGGLPATFDFPDRPGEVHRTRQN